MAFGEDLDELFKALTRLKDSTPQLVPGHVSFRFTLTAELGAPFIRAWLRAVAETCALEAERITPGRDPMSPEEVQQEAFQLLLRRTVQLRRALGLPGWKLGDLADTG